MANPGAAIFGCAGTRPTPDEKQFFANTDPLGFILFKRNCEDRDQVRGLVAELRAAVGRDDAPVLIDQEGGRVQRLQPPEWRAAPPSRMFGDLYERAGDTAERAAWLNARLIASDLHELGVDVDCLPVLDVPTPGAHDIIGDRAFGDTPETVIRLGRAAANGLMAGGVLPVVKHIPGHGRAGADSHLELPVVDAGLADLAARDFAPFRALADLPWAMTAHVRYTALDAESPATLSAAIIGEIIRREIGFEGLLLTDDISMKALSGSFGERTAHSLAAGCDVVLHCNGRMDEMVEIASELTPMTDAAAERFQRGRAMLTEPDDFDPAEGLARLSEILESGAA